ncbi:MAG: alpha/beta fold hydrolase [Bryobacteraceae bacterium]
MAGFRAMIAAMAISSLGIAQEHVSFPAQDGGVVYALVHGKGERGVVLAHGARFNKESWDTQARAIAEAGFRVVAIDFRGYGQSKGPGQGDIFTAPLELDVLAAVKYLRGTGAKSVALVGASLGGWAASKAAAKAHPGEIDRLVLLAAFPDEPEKLKLPKLFLVAREDSDGTGPRLPRIRALYDRAPEPKELIVLEGSAHAQFLFETDQGHRVMSEILRFLAAP